MKSTARFSVDPRLSALLGESYTSSERALRELVDNAWDAEARVVKITLPNIEFAKRLLTFQKKVEGLVSEWDELEDLRDTASPEVQEIVSKRFFGKKKKGEITPHTDYFPTILQGLVDAQAWRKSLGASHPENARHLKRMPRATCWSGGGPRSVDTRCAEIWHQGGGDSDAAVRLLALLQQSDVEPGQGGA